MSLKYEAYFLIPFVNLIIWMLEKIYIYNGKVLEKFSRKYFEFKVLL